MKRRASILALATLGAGAWAAHRWWPDKGWRNPCLPATLPENLASHPLVRAAWEGVDPNKVWDMHVHVAGTGDSGSGIALNPAMDSPTHPILYVKKRIFMAAACAAEQGEVDKDYMNRLLRQIAAFPTGVKCLLYAMDQFHDKDGRAVPARTGIYVPNEHVRDLARAHPDRYEWAASIHPYREDAIETLDRCVRDGARAIKWLPSSMGIDPALARNDGFYARLRTHDLPLIVHTGKELSVSGEGFDQRNNNPLRLRRPLAAGVRVVAAHCASLGTDLDLDKGSKADKVSSFELWARMMDEPLGQLLYGDLSAIPQFLRYSVLPKLIQREAWHSRLLNGSDYPLPGILPLYLMKELVRAGLLGVNDAGVLLAVRDHNPLLFDLMLKRSLHWQSRKFPVSCFETRSFFVTPG
ncbi:MAG: amidohydrolase family protein [Thiobacillaceae bacterium]